MEEKFSEFYENYKNKLDEIYIKFNQEKNKIERRFFLAMIVFLILFVFATYKLKLLFDCCNCSKCYSWNFLKT